VKVKELEQTLRKLLASKEADAAVRTQLETLAQAERSFAGFTWLWGPALYRRNRVLFRPFILSQFGTWLITDRKRLKAVEWKGDIARALEAWLAEVDRRDDVALFRRLFEWKLSTTAGWRREGRRLRAFLAELLDRLRAAGTPAARQIVLQKFDLWFTLDEATALAIYAIDPAAGGAFILRRLPSSAWGGAKRVLWKRLLRAAIDRGDEDFRWKLYRRQVPLKQWQKEVLALCRTTPDSEQLVAALERQHPEGWGLEVGETFLRLLKERERDVLPYLARHLGAVRKRWFSFGRDAFRKLRDFVSERQWWDFWAALMRISADDKEFDASVAALVQNTALPETEVVSRLRLLAGVSREWNWGGFGLATIHQLTDDTAVALYQRFPELTRGSFRQHLQAGVWGTKYNRFLETVIVAGDEAMIDFLASRFITRVPNRWNNAKAMVEEAERLSHYYEGLKTDDAAFTRRAAAVLGQVPAYSIFNYDALMRGNRLARLLFERSAKSFLGEARSMADLVEAPEIHVQALAYRALGLDDDRARTLAAANLPVLIGTLLRPLQRATRTLAFGALANAATTPEHARLIHDRARDALTLPDARYPKERLLGLIARLLHRWPELRGRGEQPRIFEQAA
jgi:hypothetical protein